MINQSERGGPSPACIASKAARRMDGESDSRKQYATFIVSMIKGLGKQKTTNNKQPTTTNNKQAQSVSRSISQSGIYTSDQLTN